MTGPSSGRDQINFDYSKTEWTRICSVVVKVRSEPLTDIERDALRIAADDYLYGLRRRRAGMPSRGTERKAWEKICKLIGNLQQAIETAADAHQKLQGSAAELPAFIVTEQMMAVVLGKAMPGPTMMTLDGRKRMVTLPFTLNFGAPIHVMTVSEINTFLSQMKITSRIRRWRAVGLVRVLSRRARAGPSHVLHMCSKSFGYGRIDLEGSSNSPLTQPVSPAECTDRWSTTWQRSVAPS